MRFETAETGTLRAENITLDVYILDQLREYTRLARTQPQNIMGEKKLAWAKQVAHHYPFDSSLTRYIKALTLNDRVEEAVSELEILKGLHAPRYYQSVLYWLREQPDNPTMQSILLQFEQRNSFET